MNKLRENTGVVLWILVISFGVIWVLQDSGAFNVVGGGSADIIVVNGEPISYEIYNRTLNQQLEQYQQQFGEQMPPQRVDQEQNRVFDALVEDKLREQEMDRLGIEVTDDEVFELVVGDNPHPLIQSYFGDGQGNVDQALLRSFIDDPEQREQWINIETYLRAERRRQKLNSLIDATVRVTEADVLAEYRKRNLRVATDFVALLYASIPDDSITVNDSDFRRYYDENKEDFARDRTYTIKFVTLSKNPTAEDSTVSLENVGKLRDTFTNAENDSVFLAQYGSETPYSDAFFRADELERTLSEAIFEDPTPGRIIGPFMAGNQVHLVKIREVEPAETVSVHARHILISAPQGTDEATRAQARQRAEQIKQQIQDGTDFAVLARQHSDDPSSKARGGDLGWFGEGRMVAPFEQAAVNATIGEVVGPVETEYGYHLIEVLDRADQQVKITDFSERLRASTATLGDAEERLEDLQYYAEESGDFEAEAGKLGLEVQEMQVEQDQRALPGLGASGTLLNFLADAEEGAISGVIELDQQFLVAYVDAIQPEGYRPFDEVRAEIEPRVRLAKKREVLAARMQRTLDQHGFDGLAQALGTTLRTAPSVSFNDMSVPILGRDPIFAGTVLGMNQGATSGVVEGEVGAFVARVNRVMEPAAPDDATKTQLRDQLLRQRRGQVQREWIASLREQADIEDNRRRLLR